MDEYLSLAHQMYPDAGCELEYNSNFQLLIAVVLSAQTTDKSVNKVTKILFDKYKDVASLAKASYQDLERIIRPIGLAKSKAKYVKSIANVIHDMYHDEVPNDFRLLNQLPGVGRKTANVVMATAFHEPHIAVDTHVYRVSTRLGLIHENDSVVECEMALQKRYPKEEWILVHHTFLFFGRYCCKSINPLCKECLLAKICKYNKRAS